MELQSRTHDALSRAARPILDTSIATLKHVISSTRRGMPGPTWPAILASIGVCVVACRLLRFQRVRYWHWKLPYKTRASFADMTTQDAQSIATYVTSAEMPFTSLRSLQFALFRTYGIPTISKLLVKTAQLSTREHAMKRYADTTVLVTEMTSETPGGERYVDAMARLNFIHGVYQKSGQISNDDMLYTLGMFALEPKRWIERYEWRRLTDMELCAFGVQWKEIGGGMNISYEPLASYGTGWRDGLHWIEDLDAWGRAYEERAMLPHVWNKQTADETVELLLATVPLALRPMGRKMVSAVMDDRLRTAMMYAPPPWGYDVFVKTAFGMRRFVLRHLTLPRLMATPSSQPRDQRSGKLFANDYEGEPWYIKPTLWSRWNLRAWMNWFVGLPLPGDDGDKYAPGGFNLPMVGPKSLMNRGETEFEEHKTRIREMGLGRRCPFPGVKKEQ